MGERRFSGGIYDSSEFSLYSLCLCASVINYCSEKTTTEAQRHRDLPQVAVEEVDHDAIVGFALFSGRGRHAEATQRQIGARFDISWDRKTALQRCSYFAQVWSVSA